LSWRRSITFTFEAGIAGAAALDVAENVVFVEAQPIAEHTKSRRTRDIWDL